MDIFWWSIEMMFMLFVDLFENDENGLIDSCFV